MPPFRVRLNRSYYFACPGCMFPRGMASTRPCGCGTPPPKEKLPITDAEWKGWRDSLGMK